jgi:hypothetical protein
MSVDLIGTVLPFLSQELVKAEINALLVSVCCRASFWEQIVRFSTDFIHEPPEEESIVICPSRNTYN